MKKHYVGISVAALALTALVWTIGSYAEPIGDQICRVAPSFFLNDCADSPADYQKGTGRDHETLGPLDS